MLLSAPTDGRYATYDNETCDALHASCDKRHVTCDMRHLTRLHAVCPVPAHSLTVRRLWINLSRPSLYSMWYDTQPALVALTASHHSLFLVACSPACLVWCLRSSFSSTSATATHPRYFSRLPVRSQALANEIGLSSSACTPQCSQL